MVQLAQPFYWSFCFVKDKTFVAHVGFELAAVLPLPSEHWNYRLALPCPAKRALICYRCLAEGVEADLSRHPFSPRSLEVSYFTRDRETRCSAHPKEPPSLSLATKLSEAFSPVLTAMVPASP